MTYEEAKMQIQAIPEKIWDQLSEPDREAMEMAFSALEKQIPSKATFDPDMDYVECPVCCQLTNANGFPEDIKYCYHCGKAFDWEGGA